MNNLIRIFYDSESVEIGGTIDDSKIKKAIDFCEERIYMTKMAKRGASVAKFRFDDRIDEIKEIKLFLETLK